jgi:lactate permease
MATLLDLAPFAVVIGLLASGRAGGLGAGLAGLLAAIPAIANRTADPAALPAFLLEQSARGVALGWHAASVIIAGFFFYRTVVATQPAASSSPEPTQRSRYRTLFRSCFLLGVFAESLTGFGVGYLVAFGVVSTLGLRSLDAVILAGFSQVLVAFGALAVGTGIGASLAGIPVRDLGMASALLAIPLLAGFVLIFWSKATAAGIGPTPGDRVLDLCYLACMVGFLYLFSRVNAVELAGLGAAALVLALDVVLRDRGLSNAAWRARWSQAWPYVAVTAALLASRLMPGAREWLSSLAMSRPFADQPAFAWVYSPFFFLIVGGIVTVIARGRFNRLGAIFTASARGAWRAAAVTWIFVTFGQWLIAAGVAQALAQAAINVLGPAALLASPFVGALAGFLTGSNTGSNSMAMPVQASLAAGMSFTPSLLPALQNSMGSCFALLAPPRVAMMKGFAGAGTTEAQILRALAPVGAMILSIGVAVVAVALLARPVS